MQGGQGFLNVNICENIKWLFFNEWDSDFALKADQLGPCMLNNPQLALIDYMNVHC